MMRSRVRSSRSLRALAGLGAAAALALAHLAPPPAPALARSAEPALASAGQPVSVAEWSRMVWVNAVGGNSDVVFGLLSRLPADHTDENVRDLRAAADRLEKHAAERSQQRATRLEELRGDLVSHAASNELTKALDAAIEIFALSADKGSVATSPDVAPLIRRAEADARKAEAEGRWLDAQDLYYRLSLLYEDQGRHREDLTRMGDRLSMLRMYAPERLHEMRNAQRLRDGEEPLPYNKIGEQWRDKLDGVDQFMVRRAVLRAKESHVDHKALNALLAGGLRSVRTLATTTDLASAFPGLGDENARARFVADLDTRIGQIEQGAPLDDFAVNRTLMSVLDVNAQTVRLPQEAVLRAFGDGSVAQLDEFSSIIWPDEVPRFLRTTQGKFTGVGIQIQLDEARNLKVVTPIEGTPAQRAGIKQGDLIRKVDGDSTLGITLLQAVDRITGPAGTSVTLAVERPGEHQWIDFTLTRAEIPIYTVKGWRRDGAHETDWDWMISPEHRIGYVRLTQFTDDTTAHLDAAIREMKAANVAGIILDLRFNPGGLLSQAVSVANRFVNEGVIVTQHDVTGVQTDAQTARRGMASLKGVPVVVLINEGSASASEIVAGCLQDYARDGVIDAAIVGQRSFGKGSVQNVYDLARGQAILKLTERYYHLPKGRLIHRKEDSASWGVEPDIEVDMLPKQVEKALEIRQDADILALDQAGNVIPDAKRPDPQTLLDEGIDPQLEVALLLLQSQAVGRASGHAMLPPSKGE